jgi:hypothetical protein
MKKTLATLALSLGLGLTGIAQYADSTYNSLTKQETFNKIDKEKRFDKCSFKNNFIGYDISENGNFITAYYNFDLGFFDNEPDLMAFFRKDNSIEPADSMDCPPYGAMQNPEIVTIDKNGDSFYDDSYIDPDRDGILKKLGDKK